MKHDFWQSVREKAEIHETGLKILIKDKRHLMMWKPKAQNPYFNRLYNKYEHLERDMNQLITNFLNWQKLKEERKQKRMGTPEDLEKIKTGDIFHWSWGYDQTNCYFYQVLERNGKKLTLREIAQKTVPDSDGCMSESRIAIKDKFIENEKPFTKIVQFWGGEPYINMEHGSCGPWDGKPKYCSWYA